MEGQALRNADVQTARGLGFGPGMHSELEQRRFIIILPFGEVHGGTLGDALVSGNWSEGAPAKGADMKPRWDASVGNIAITVFAAVVIFCTLAGNTLVITAVIKERRLRKVSNSFVINLAVSDILVGLLVTPIALAYHLHRKWIFSRQLCDFWISVDVICCTASITNLCAISYDRYNAITEPLRYARKRTLKRACLLILIVWLYSVCIAVPPFFGWGLESDETKQLCQISQDVGYTFYSTVGAFYLPLLFMIFAYICIYRETSKRTRQWKRGPGSSKMIQERSSNAEHGADGDALNNIRLMQLAGEMEPLAPHYPAASHQRLQPRSSLPEGFGWEGSFHLGMVGCGVPRRASGSGLFLRSSAQLVRHSIPYEAAIVEVDENTRKEGSSSSGGSSSTHNANPSSFFQATTILSSQVPAGAAAATPEESGVGAEAGAGEGTLPAASVSAEPYPRPAARRSQGSNNFPRKLIRQISNLPSSDSSTVTSSSSSSANTTSSSDVPLDLTSPYERRFSSAALVARQNAQLGVERKESLARALHESALGPAAFATTSSCSSSSTLSPASRPSRKSVTFLAPTSHYTTTDGSSDKNVSPSDQSDSNVASLFEVKDKADSLEKDLDADDRFHHHHLHPHHPYRHHEHHRHKRRKKISVSQEKRAAKTLSIVMGGFIFCWLPFFVVALIEPLCLRCTVPPTLHSIVLWLGYCNSALNPIIYTFFNKDFRFAFQKILRCSKIRRSTSL